MKGLGLIKIISISVSFYGNWKRIEVCGIRRGMRYKDMVELNELDEMVCRISDEVENAVFEYGKDTVLEYLKAALANHGFTVMLKEK